MSQYSLIESITFISKIHSEGNSTPGATGKIFVFPSFASTQSNSSEQYFGAASKCGQILCIEVKVPLPETSLALLYLVN